jgi:hypothetical protein
MIDPFVFLAPLMLLAIVALLGFIGCEPFGASPDTQVPSFSPAPGIYFAEQWVTLQDPGATIYFTTGPGSPDSVYSAPIQVSATTTIKAYATSPGGTPSEHVDGIYIILPPPAPPPPATPPAYVQRQEISQTANNNLVTTPAFPTFVNPGNLMIVWIWYHPVAGESVSTVTDTANNSYARAVGPTQGTGGFTNRRQEIWYSKLTKTVSNLQVITTFSGTFNDKKAIAAHEYKGLDPAWALRQSAANTGNTANASCGPVPVTANELIFAAALLATTGTSGPGFARRSSLDGNVTEDEVPGAAGSVAATFANTAQDWIAQMVTFK